MSRHRHVRHDHAARWSGLDEHRSPCHRLMRGIRTFRSQCPRRPAEGCLYLVALGRVVFSDVLLFLLSNIAQLDVGPRTIVSRRLAGWGLVPARQESHHERGCQEAAVIDEPSRRPPRSKPSRIFSGRPIHLQSTPQAHTSCSTGVRAWPHSGKDPALRQRQARRSCRASAPPCTRRASARRASSSAAAEVARTWTPHVWRMCSAWRLVGEQVRKGGGQRRGNFGILLAACYRPPTWMADGRGTHCCQSCRRA